MNRPDTPRSGPGERDRAGEDRGVPPDPAPEPKPDDPGTSKGHGEIVPGDEDGLPDGPAKYRVPS